jgi:hypothetical protein
MARAPHPYADLFPLMNEAALKELPASISKDGLQDPITTFEGKVLDGRNRQLACSNAKVKPVYRRYTGDDPLGFVMRSNLHHRHLTVNQRSMIAAKMANLPRHSGGGKRHMRRTPITIPEAADILKVSKASVDRAKK